MTPWREIEKGKWQRPRSGAEVSMPVFNHADLSFGKENYILFLTADIETQGALMSADFKIMLVQAWKTLRFMHPALGLRLDGDNVTYESPTSNAALESWVQQTVFIISDPSVTVNNLAKSLPAPGLPELYFFAPYGQLALRASHWRFNATGLLHTMNNLLELIVSSNQDPLPWGEETVRLRPTLEAALGVVADPPQAAKDYVHDMLAKAHQSGKSAGLSTTCTNLRPGDTHMQELRLTQNATDRFIRWCRSRKFTVTAVIHAALAKATFELAAPECIKCDQCLLLVYDIRLFKSLATSPLINEYPVDCPLTTKLAPISRSDPFDRLADSLTKCYRSEFDDKTHLQANAYYSDFITAFTIRDSKSETIQPETPRLSSLGVLEKYIKHEYSTPDGKGCLHMLDIALRSENPTRVITVWLSTWRDQLRLVAGYNDAYANQDDISALMRKVVHEAEVGTGIKLEIDNSFKA